MARALLSHPTPATLPSSSRVCTKPSPKILPNRTLIHSSRQRPVSVRAGKTHSVEIEHHGKKHLLQVAENESILSKALEAGIALPHDCKLGVCMTCPARLVRGEVDQSEGMLSDDVIEKGYALMCSSYPRSDCSILTIPEDELLSLQLATAED
eukprot:TRINITY_DN1922_c0_g1_i1.p1 TRINITY_DN1922_c0_g1~~TRINITY_DN1922_c0_g1_i1.p1  ORF type:complete len:153 (-),score=30.14 TRINITY_DN1922_c0_g1_i1:354-812(-)